ncbi:flagellar biosynthesis protein FlgF [Microvirga ossetica]|uniref:Flagellar biosynthesis protein FlgF n=1 Tax=Microvirga ossetica TaxID=1882682 RepID=A0A1B2EHY2_9HYPH|nr:DUF1217 domain-containing protein [Microvirga ossetica]ANY79462.1 flagellar biosynthesis protein FlgF [Microvirga ossetica]
MISTSTRYQIITKDLARTKALIEKEPATKREIEYYQANIKTIKTIDEFIKNDRLFKFAMKAYGLEDMAYGKGLMKKLLKEGVSNPLSMANKMSNPLYKEFAKAFDFAAKGAEATSAAGATTDAVAKYVQITLEKKEGDQNQGVQLAMYFKRKASSVTTTMGLLADKALLKFVQNTFNIPEAASRADLDIQVRNLEKHLNVKDLQDPKKVDKLIQRFSAMWDVNNASTTMAAPVLTLFDQSSSVQQGFSVDLMMSITKLRLGG